MQDLCVRPHRTTPAAHFCCRPLTVAFCLLSGAFEAHLWKHYSCGSITDYLANKYRSTFESAHEMMKGYPGCQPQSAATQCHPAAAECQHPGGPCLLAKVGHSEYVACVSQLCSAASLLLSCRPFPRRPGSHTKALSLEKLAHGQVPLLRLLVEGIHSCKALAF